jgi:FixJ family two-component response regulator
MSSGAKPLVAVVDDDSRVLESLEDLLESAGYATRVFPSAREFLQSGVLGSIGCLISDIRMPDVDGWQLLAVATRERPNLPVILITAHEECRRDHTNPAPILFKKPFDGKELLASVRTLIDAHP